MRLTVIRGDTIVSLAGETSGALGSTEGAELGRLAAATLKSATASNTNAH